MKIPLLIYAGFFPVWLVFYMTGVYIGRFSDRAYNSFLPFLIVLIGLVLSQIESSFLVSHYGTGFGIKPSSFLYAFGTILLIFSSHIEKIIRKLLGDSNKLLIYVGNISFAIYLAHLSLLDHLVCRFSDSWSVKWVSTLVISIVLIHTIRWILPTKYHKYLGI